MEKQNKINQNAICLAGISRFTLHLEIDVLLSHMQMNKCGETKMSHAKRKGRDEEKHTEPQKRTKPKKMKSASMAKVFIQ